MNQNGKTATDALSQTLDELIKVYRNLLETVRKEREILVSAQLDDLNENNRTKEAALVRINELEGLRLAQARDLATSLGLSEEPPRLLELARHLDGPVGERFRNIHSVLELLVQRVQEHNKFNEVLVRSALENITGAMKSIRESLQEKPTYERKGEVRAQPASSGQLVSKEA